MKFFERFSVAKPRKETKDSSNFDSAHQGLIDAAKSHNATLAEVAETRKLAQAEMSTGIQGAREDHAVAVARASNIELLKEQAQLTAHNQLLGMKIEHATLVPEELSQMRSEVETNTARIAEIEAIIAKAIQDAKESVK